MVLICGEPFEPFLSHFLVQVDEPFEPFLSRFVDMT
jgi:hypothetical protein